MSSALHASCLLLTLAGLTACQKPFRTSIDNETSENLSVVIYFDDQLIPEGHGEVAPGNGVNLTQHAEGIRSIEWKSESQSCRLDKRAIKLMSSPLNSNITRIALGKCPKAI